MLNTKKLLTKILSSLGSSSAMSTTVTAEILYLKTKVGG